MQIVLLIHAFNDEIGVQDVLKSLQQLHMNIVPFAAHKQDVPKFHFAHVACIFICMDENKPWYWKFNY